MIHKNTQKYIERRNIECSNNFTVGQVLTSVQNKATINKITNNGMLYMSDDTIRQAHTTQCLIDNGTYVLENVNV